MRRLSDVSVYHPQSTQESLRCLHLPTCEVGYGRQMVILGQIKWVLRGEVSDLPTITREWTRAVAKALDPLGLFSFYFEPAQLSRICFSQQTSVFLSKSCQFFLSRWARTFQGCQLNSEKGTGLWSQNKSWGLICHLVICMKPLEAGLRRTSGSPAVTLRYTASLPPQSYGKNQNERMDVKFLIKLQIPDK